MGILFCKIYLSARQDWIFHRDVKSFHLSHQHTTSLRYARGIINSIRLCLTLPSRWVVSCVVHICAVIRRMSFPVGSSGLCMYFVHSCARNIRVKRGPSQKMKMALCYHFPSSFYDAEIMDNRMHKRPWYGVIKPHHIHQILNFPLNSVRLYLKDTA